MTDMAPPMPIAKTGLGERVINQGPICVGYICNMLMAWAGEASIKAMPSIVTQDGIEANFDEPSAITSLMSLPSNSLITYK